MLPPPCAAGHAQEARQGAHLRRLQVCAAHSVDNRLRARVCVTQRAQWHASPNEHDATSSDLYESKNRSRLLYIKLSSTRLHCHVALPCGFVCRAVVDIVIKKTGPPQRRKESKVLRVCCWRCEGAESVLLALLGCCWRLTLGTWRAGGGGARRRV